MTIPLRRTSISRSDTNALCSIPTLILFIIQMSLLSATGGAHLGHTQKTVVTIVGDDGE